MIDLNREDNVFILRFDVPENRFRPDGLAAWNEALDEVEAAGSPAALVTTGTGKFYSNGLDLEWLMGQSDEAVRSAYVPGVLALMARILTFPTVTVAAINGHSFGAGAQLTPPRQFVCRATDELTPVESDKFFPIESLARGGVDDLGADHQFVVGMGDSTECAEREGRAEIALDHGVHPDHCSPLS